MDRTLIIPISIAAALHAGVLFGFPRGKVPALIVKPIADFVQIIIPAQIDPPDPVVPTYTAARKGSTDPVVPVSADTSVPGPGFEIPITRVPPVEIAHPVATIGDLMPGVRDGVVSSSWNNLVNSIALDNPPRTRTQVPPLYPMGAKQTGITGKVVVEFIVDESGRVLEPRVVDSTDRVFEEPTLRAISRWRFEPGRRHGQIVRFHMALPVDFNLNER